MVWISHKFTLLISIKLDKSNTKVLQKSQRTIENHGITHFSVMFWTVLKFALLHKKNVYYWYQITKHTNRKENINVNFEAKHIPMSIIANDLMYFL